MKYVTEKDLKISPEIWKMLPTERELIVTNNGKPIAFLTPIHDEMLEITIFAVRKAKAFYSMKKMHEISASLGNNKMTLEQINAVINEVRRKNKK